MIKSISFLAGLLLMSACTSLTQNAFDANAGNASVDGSGNGPGRARQR